MQYERVIYLDTAIKMKSNALEPIASAADELGIMTRYHPTYITCFSDPRSFVWFGEEAASFEGVRTLEANLLVLNRNHVITTLVMKAWVMCALDAQCIAPEGSYRYGGPKNWLYGCSETSCGCHRYDQHALSVIGSYFFGIPVDFEPAKPACVLTNAETSTFYDVERRATHNLWIDQIKYVLLIFKSYFF